MNLSEKYNQLKSLNIVVDRVKLLKKETRLVIYIKSYSILLDSQLKDINSIFINKFPDLEIDIKIQYILSGTMDEILRDYELVLEEYIENKIPSSKSWIRDLKYKLEEDCLIIFPPNQVAYFSLEHNGLLDDLRMKINNELQWDINIKLNEDKYEENNNFLELKKLEEQKLSKETLKASLNNSDKSNSGSKSEDYKFGKNIRTESMKINDITMEIGSATIEGEIFQIESRPIRDKRVLISFYISDLSDSITVKVFLSLEQGEEFLKNIQNGSYVKLSGDITYDNYSKSMVIMLRSLEKAYKPIRQDKAKEKRVELHLHTQMSAMDGITNLKAVAERAKAWGHKAIAITDHGVVQAFPEAMNLSKNLGIKMIYGVEGYLTNDKKNIITNYNPKIEYNSFVVFDIETTGLSAINDKITEIGAVKIVDGEIVDNFSQLINPERRIPEHITKITNITDEMVRDKPTIGDVIGDFKDFIEGSVLVAHNASFDIGFIRENMKHNKLVLNNPILDTLELSRVVYPTLKSHRLNVVAKHLDVSLINHHRAVEDAKATAGILLKTLDMLKEKNIITFDQINSLNSGRDISKDETYHIIILAKNLIGLKNLYRLISKSHMDYFYRRPRIPKSLLESHREGLILGTACESGELFKAIISNKSNKEIDDITKFYDFLEIQPKDNNMFLIREGILKNEKQLEEINEKIYNLGNKHNKLVVATGDVHFLDPEDEVYRRILMSGQGFADADIQPPLYFKTTDEMLKEFNYLGEKKSYEVVIKNTNLINNMIEDIKPIPDGTYPPIIEGSEKELKNITYEKATEIYGTPLPDIVKSRLDMELNSIITNGYAVMYIIAQKLVWKSLEDGYLVGSRGSVGSSFAATMSGITEINPLVPHYICSNCKYNEFFVDGTIASGADLPDKECPECKTQLNKDGHDIPFEVFLGFDGDKEPDIDLNFAGEYQAKAHRYTEELFGEGYVFRAGTIGTIADKTAYGFVRKYFEEKGIDVNPVEINRLIQGCTGIRRSSGQHPGGVMIVPKYKDILDFTPIQYPANDSKSGVITTHFDYNAISGRILKLDILGHDVPTIIRMLEDITGIDPRNIPLDEPSTMKLFTSTEPLGIKEEDINCQVGSLGIPEFGTKFVRQMLVDTQPTTFSELVMISGLSHGTDVWLNNAQDLVRNNIAPLSKVISTREDIMLYLINAGMDKKRAFFIMENVRRGKGLSPEDEEEMRKLNVPEWYIESCNKIKYMFPKAHAAAYVMMSFRIAYFKVHHPEAFYATYFTTKAADFDAQLILQGRTVIKEKIDELESLGNNATAKERNLLTVLEVALEMYARGLKFQKVDLYRSHSDRFIIHEDGILPPLKGLEGVGETAARNIMEARDNTKFISIEDLVQRTRVSRTVVEALSKHGCLSGLPESNQISLFNV